MTGPRPPTPARTTGELVPTALTPHGEAVARDQDGHVHFITGALPGERVAVTVTRRLKTYSRSRVARIIEPSPHRVAAPCAEFRRGCGACQWQDVDLGLQRQLKESMVTDAIRRFGKFDPPTPRPTRTLAPWHYRTTIRAAVTDGRAGFRQRSSHEVVDVEGCLVAHPLLTGLLTRQRYPGASEVVLRCGARTGDRLVASTPAGLDIALPDDVRTDYLYEVAAHRRWRISPRSFFQSRPDGADALAEEVATAAADVGHPTEAVDLYCGVGLFAGVLSDGGWQVTAVENDLSAVRDAAVNLADDAVRLVKVDVDRWTPRRADLVVADPSRTGLGRRGAAAVVATGATRVVLISCDAQSLGMDARRLRLAGYEMTSVILVELFPHSVHVEVVSVFDR